MKKNRFFLLVFLFVITPFLAQTKVSGTIVDKSKLPIPYANVIFKGSSEGVVSNEDGHFYLESQKNYKTLVVKSVGFSDREIV